MELKFRRSGLVRRVAEVGEAIFEVEGSVQHVASDLRFPGKIGDAGRPDGHPFGLTEEDSLHGGKDCPSGRVTLIINFRIFGDFCRPIHRRGFPVVQCCCGRCEWIGAG